MAKKQNFLLFLIITASVFLAWGGVLAETEDTAGEVSKFKNAAIIPCKGMIDDGLYASIKRRSEMALEAGADYLIYEISTYGGLIKSADDISKYFILDLGPQVHTVAYITTEAISAGAMISVSCKDIIMRQATTIGDCAPIKMGDKLEDTEREKIESFIRATFSRAAEANGYPAVLLKAMVSRHVRVYKVKNRKTGEWHFYESEKLPKDTKKFDLKNKELVISEKEILTLNAAEAKEYGIAREIVSGRDEALDFLASRDGIEFNSPVITYQTNWSEELVRMLNHPTFTGILFMVGLLGVYIELKTPGIGLPGLVAVICFTILFGSRFLVGLATWWEVAIFIVGVILLMVEIFVIPGFGIAGITGLMFIFVGLFAILVPNRPDELPWPKYDFDWQIFTKGAWGFGLGFVGFLIVAWILAKILPKTRILGGLILAPAAGGGRFES